MSYVLKIHHHHHHNCETAAEATRVSNNVRWRTLSLLSARIIVDGKRWTSATPCRTVAGCYSGSLPVALVIWNYRTTTTRPSCVCNHPDITSFCP